MATWAQFARSAPEMAEAGRKLIYQLGDGFGFLATVRKDGGPRLHPFCPIITGGGLYGLIGPSPKRYDLLRDGRYAIHSMPPKDVDDEFYVTGASRRIEDEGTIRAARAAYEATGGSTSDDDWLFEFDIERALLATYEPRPSWPPEYRKWAAR
jgi:hypothetical protein